MSEQRDVIFILDGAPNSGEVCGLTNCFEKAIGVYEMCDADSMEYLGSVGLCKLHGESLATGGAIADGGSQSRS